MNRETTKGEDGNDSDPSTDEQREYSSPTDRNGITRRGTIAGLGTLAAAGVFGTGTAAAATAPGTFTGFQDAIQQELSDAQSTIDGGPYDPSWDSLAGVDQTPEWFRDGKFGIYFHWGVYSVPAYFNEWYPRHMYELGHTVHDHHTNTYGSPDSFPYQNFVDDFTAANFDASAWADLFQAAGAQFAGPVAEHHDGFSLWDSGLSPWNATDRGPLRDLAGELETAIRNNGMNFVTTFHHARNSIGDGPDGHFEHAFNNYPSVTDGYPDRVMYGNMSDSLNWDTWRAKVTEVIRTYDPDLVYFDSWLDRVPDGQKLDLLAYHYNHADSQGSSVVAARKQHDLPLNSSVDDFEKGRPRVMEPQPWLTDDTVTTGSWCYTEGLGYKSPEQLIHILADIVSKNGQLMLNIAPQADGTIPQAQRDRLNSIGNWLDVNGEAIYDTRPWETGSFGEGPNRLESGGWFAPTVYYDPDDVRYTVAKDGSAFYAIILGQPGGGWYTLEGTDVVSSSGGATELLGHGSVGWTVTTDGHLEVDLPSSAPTDHAIVVKCTGFDLEDNFNAHADYRIENAAGTEVANIANQSTDDDANAELWSWDDSTGQHFDFIPNGDGTYRIQNVNSQKVLEVGGGGTSNGDNVNQWSWAGEDWQKWNVIDNGDGTHRIENVHSGKVLDFEGTDPSAGSNLIQWDWTSSEWQKWNLTKVSSFLDDGRYMIRPRHSGKALDVDGVSTADGANVHQWSWWGGDNQKFDLTYLGNGEYRIDAAHSGKPIEVANAGTADGDTIQQNTWSDGDHQKWRVERAAGGNEFHVVNVNSGKAMDVAGSSTADGADIHQWTVHGGDNQRFQFDRVEISID